MARRGPVRSWEQNVYAVLTTETTVVVGLAQCNRLRSKSSSGWIEVTMLIVFHTLLIVFQAINNQTITVSGGAGQVGCVPGQQ